MQEDVFGELVWAAVGHYPWWPAIIVPGPKGGILPADRNKSWVLWFGDHKVSKVPQKKIVPFIPNYRKYASPSKHKKNFAISLEEVLMKRLPNWVKERIGELYQTNNDSIEEECSDDAPECSFRIEKKNLGGNLAKVKVNELRIEEVCIACESFDVTEQHPFFKGGLCESCKVRQ
ncbi:DNA (cytosine-5)-methyltransferase 3 like [Paralvinella palmiformis]|uniref:DNA (Cytosine-5)-methyltransferase 3 like n=1 Tax=Paralvinella palmiformis TaxID=53620 RepID=A0AAD9IPY6_9ANNE|nr:DNA (cytosine-5)-methyltransferase 3 like [Paralvinella palmiformis]